MKSLSIVTTIVACLTFCGADECPADITIDYSHDQATDNFFGTNLEARNALEAAVADINAILNLNMTEITAAEDVISETNGSTTVSFDFDFSYTNPSTGVTQNLSSIQLPQNEIRIYAGIRELGLNMSGNDILGKGGPGGYGFNVNADGFESEFVGAMSAAEASANAVYGRGDGPTVSTISGDLTLGSTTANYSIAGGVTHGNLWFDSDSNNDGISDLTQAGVDLADQWHFNHTANVEAGKSDFYSVALHETLHVIGIGTSESWDNLVSGTAWSGTNAIALHGTGAGLIDSEGGHIENGTMSTRISDGMAQEVVMDPDILQGTRKELTHLDVAFLRDIGFSNAVAIPEPGVFLVLSLLGCAGFVRRSWRKPLATA